MEVRILPPKPTARRRYGKDHIDGSSGNGCSKDETSVAAYERITHVRGLSSMVEPKSVKLVTEVQFFQSPPYYYEHIQTSILITMWLIKKKFKISLDFWI